MDKRLLISALIIFSTPVWSVTYGQEPVPRDFDHNIYVQIESEPSGADIHAISATGKTITDKLGVSPCTTVIGLKWAERFGRRRWPDLTVWTPGDACRAEYNKGDKTYDLYFNCAAVERGYFAKDMEVKIATLTRPGYGWEPPESWPQRVIINMDLVEKNSASDRPEDRPSRIPKIILAAKPGDGEMELGTIQIRCDQPGAYVFVDGKRIKTAPLDVMVPAGWRTISIRKDGYAVYRTEVNLKPQATERIDATLER